MGDESKVATFKKPYIGTLLAIFVLAGQVLVFTAQLWVSAGYVAKIEFEAYKNDQLARREKTSENLAAIAVTLAQINERMKNDSEQNTKLEDLEKRMRIQEQHK